MLLMLSIFNIRHLNIHANNGRIELGKKPIPQGYSTKPHSKDRYSADREAQANDYKTPYEDLFEGISAGRGLWYKKWVEIVPQGEEPAVDLSITKYFVRDDGTFINPDLATPVPRIPRTSLGDGLPNDTYRFVNREANGNSRVGITETNMLLLQNLLKYSILTFYWSKKLLRDTVLMLKVIKSRSERELLNLGELFKAFHHLGGRLLWIWYKSIKTKL